MTSRGTDRLYKIPFPLSFSPFLHLSLPYLFLSFSSTLSHSLFLIHSLSFSLSHPLSSFSIFPPLSCTHTFLFLSLSVSLSLSIHHSFSHSLSLPLSSSLSPPLFLLVKSRYIYICLFCRVEWAWEAVAAAAAARGSP